MFLCMYTSLSYADVFLLHFGQLKIWSIGHSVTFSFAREVISFPQFVVRFENFQFLEEIVL
jgi:hypothetical protein